MTLTAEQILASHKANIETLFGLTSKAFEGVEKLVELNVSASRAALSEVANHAQAVLGVKDAQELLALQASLFQPLAEKTAAYSRHLYDIGSGTGAEFGKAFETQASDAQKAFATLVDSAAKNAPAGSETAVAVMRAPSLRPPTLLNRCKRRSSRPPTWPKPTSTPWPALRPTPPRRSPRASAKSLTAMLHCALHGPAAPPAPAPGPPPPPAVVSSDPRETPGFQDPFQARFNHRAFFSPNADYNIACELFAFVPHHPPPQKLPPMTKTLNPGLPVCPRAAVVGVGQPQDPVLTLYSARHYATDEA